jgi:hypothetical protein
VHKSLVRVPTSSARLPHCTNGRWHTSTELRATITNKRSGHARTCTWYISPCCTGGCFSTASWRCMTAGKASARMQGTSKPPGTTMPVAAGPGNQHRFREHPNPADTLQQEYQNGLMLSHSGPAAAARAAVPVRSRRTQRSANLCTSDCSSSAACI